ncbi:MAG: SUMF1/EgtB/PvdO family nonheme iron enzyme [Acidobacteria bacterium]|nr:SUMF1/EgtB/PvdO family nonheme iron enzyme [Acidobacteriota bacterium]MCW5949926.1 SUMF1/EgtB/PvdO family nonheme iron enzyme [Pyrinomonadaceae bacterium]
MKECQHCKSCFADTVDTCPNDGLPTTHTIAGEPVLEGKYHIESRLGQGGMGVVYKARHSYLKTLHAIKIILPDLVGNDPQLVTRFRQEALAAAAIRHQNVVSVTDYGVINGNIPFLVMEFVEGESLHDLLAREKKLSPARALELMSAICAGVGAAHHQGIVHRDLKPLNIMICTGKPNMSQAVKILDFGLAKIKSGELLGSFIQAQTTGLMGSPYYMAPEQWSDDDPDSRADIYSLGVMLYQMLAGDVPFKGSSIPAIMKKHISDPPPRFNELGAAVSHEVEKAVFHSLAKEPRERTPSVEHMVEELTNAVAPGMTTTPSIHLTAGSALPVSTLNVKTMPPRSRVSIDNIEVGESREDGSLLLEGIQSGNHLLRVSHPGFRDWVGDVVCDGKPQEIVAELRTSAADPMAISMPSPEALAAETMIAGTATGNDLVEPAVASRTAAISSPAVEAAPRRSGMSPILLGIGGLLALIVLVAVGLGAYLFFGRSNVATNSSNTPPSASPTPLAAKNELADIPGGTFSMGRNDGLEDERPAHDVTVGGFRMDKTEVTNAEYYSFVSATGYRPIPAHWVNDKPVPGTEKMPVRFVNLDDIDAFAKWRSDRDGVTYRLPTEEEWEYAAKNGAKNSRFPWGDKFEAKCAVVDRESNEPEAVGTASCQNDWGVVDLIGNVFEWTSSKAEPYPGSKVDTDKSKAGYRMIRGGAAFTKSSGDYAASSTIRIGVAPTKRDKELGFRLVTAAK